MALLAALALVVVTLGAALTPVRPREPAEPPFSEQVRVSALAETLRLKAAGEQLAQAAPGNGSGTGQPDFSRTVTLLTTQSRALLAPGDVPHDASTPFPSATPSAASSPAPLPASAAGLAADLAGSGRRRLADAAAADGGMARLLAAVGTAQLLQASALAAAAGAPAPAQADPVQADPVQADPASPLSGACPSPEAAASSSSAGHDAPTGDATLDGALAATVRTEMETVYGYQVALTRLGGEAAKPAAEQLARHEELVSAAESLSRMHCAPVPPREAGYSLGQSFLAAPATGLAGLETATLPVYADLVALSDGETRRWAISGLLDAARRAVLWGADPGPVPGLTADPAAFPTLPAGSAAPLR
ncbi:ferritin-like domain-containing protein [Arthrobacter sp. PAMC25564]|uniref:ferritin-like domain-containing protein n=1 Tax=Arthrobacter sp. PAMC25564 TaxID=2565366 RepID=UPI001446F78D|nr:ferritin-like domain-containing protein [Arthrobacter sp. PAMC25564]